MKTRFFLWIALAGAAFLAASCGKDSGYQNDISPKPKDPTAAHQGPKAVYTGDSITWQWGTAPREIAKEKIVIPLDPLPAYLTDKGSNVQVTWHPGFFSQHDYVDKGVSGETTAQMLARYQKDVLSQDPFCVVIMGGTNDLAQGVSKEDILKNLSAMAEQADAAKMKVVLCSVTPCNQKYSKLTAPNTKGEHIKRLNAMIQAYAAEKGYTYCDYYPALVAGDGVSLKEEYCLYDRLHPNPDAYTVMEGIIQPILESLLK